MGCERHSAYRLSSHWPSNYGAILRNLLDQIKIAKKKCHIVRTTPTRTSVIVMAKIHDLRYELLLYSPDLIPSDFYLFPGLKMFLGGTRFSTTEELTAEVEGYFSGLKESNFRDGIKALEHRWTKCIGLQGVYVENRNSSSDVRHFFLVHSENFSNHPCTIRSNN